MMTLMTVMTLTVVMMMRVFTWKVCQDDQHSSTRRMTIMTGLSSLSPHRLLSLSCSLVRGETAVLWFPWLSLAVLEMEREKSHFCRRDQSWLSITNGKHVQSCHLLSPPVANNLSPLRSPSDQREVIKTKGTFRWEAIISSGLQPTEAE